MTLYLFLFLFFGFALFITSLCYIDKLQIAFVGLLISTIIMSLSVASIKKNIDRQFTIECIDVGGIVVKMHLKKLRCEYLKD